MNSLALSLGSNVSGSYVLDSIEWLKTRLADFRVSELYETPAVHGGAKPYINAVAEGETSLSHDAFNCLLKDYESSHGRDAEARSEGRVPIDIDIVVWNGEVVRPRDFRHSFFQIGFSELAGTPVQCESDAKI